MIRRDVVRVVNAPWDLVQARGKGLDRLRGEAYRVSRDARTDWYLEPRSLGTAFCFENSGRESQVLCSLRKGERCLRFRASNPLRADVKEVEERSGHRRR
jgi:hypothetical protein